MKDNPAIWSRKLDDALWAFRTAYKTPTGTSPYKLVYGKICHLPFEIEHRAYWALKNYNPDLIAADMLNYMEKMARRSLLTAIDSNSTMKKIMTQGENSLPSFPKNETKKYESS
ncbi:reverse transcriptase domain-containing protein [Tanacetum coccineum]